MNNCSALITILFSMVAVLAHASGVADTQGQQSRSGYQNIPQFGGAGSVGATLKEDDLGRGAHLVGMKQGLDSYFDWKKRIKEDSGLALSFDYTANYQRASQTPGEDQAAGGGVPH